MLSTHSQLAFIFPGQGSQSVGMLNQLADHFPQFIAPFHQASEILGYDVWQLAQQGPEDLLNQTERTQPALLVAGVALFRLWQTLQGEQPAFMAGHSLGEYTALVCAGALDYADAVSLVALRGRLMQGAVQEGQGAMAAIVGLTDEQITQICQQAAQHHVLSPANFNAIGQTVVAGEVTAIERAIDLAKQAGAKIAKKIPVSVPSHCDLMRPAAEQLASHLQTIPIHAPRTPVVMNAEVLCHQEPERIRAALVAQLCQPVRWVETIQWLVHNGVQRMVECGPGKVLAGLNKRIVPELSTLSISQLEVLQQAISIS